MASGTNPSCKPGLGQEPHQPLIPSRSSSISRNTCTGNPRTLSQVVSAASLGGSPLPQRRFSSMTARHSLSPIDRVAPSFLKDGIERKHPNPIRTTRRSASCSATTQKPMDSAKIQRWSGLTRTVSDWDHGLRRDPELWYEDGDCYVHLHARGVSRRGPSFCIPFRVLRQKKCNAMLSQCDAQIASAPGSTSQELRRMPSSLTNANRERSFVELFIPASDDISREDSFRWHITTRNFFAFLLGKPLVGEHMGQAFADLQERLHIFRPNHINNHQDFLDYAENQGYRDLVECTDYALASLFYAERYKLRDVWVDAFAHCVGMNDSLVLSPEFTLTSRLTKALITRAHLEGNQHLGRVSIALSRFLQEDLSPSYLGLTDGARSHLDRFRRFLHAFYVEKFGYWPPPRGTTFPKALYKSMYYDFKNLYDYLVDTESTADFSTQRPASGGICVLQNVTNFDKRHNFKSQPHPLPLLPVYTSPPKRTDSQTALRQLTLASQHSKTYQLHTSGALMTATNTSDQNVTASKIVQSYFRFEQIHATSVSQREEKITATDARKIRWLLIYGTLQYLVSALRAPKEVRDSESPDYPLCFVAEPTTSTTSSKDTTPLASPGVNGPQAIDEYLAESQSSPYSIQPDCQREDYFTPRNQSRRSSIEVPPLKGALSLRQSSVRSFGRRSLSTRSSQRNSVTLKPTQHCAIIVPGYGGGLNEPTESSTHQANPRPASSVYSEQSIASLLPDGAGPETSWLRPRTPSAPHSRQPSTSSTIARPRTPLLDCVQLDRPIDPTCLVGLSEPPSRSDSTSSTNSSVWSEGGSAASSKSSACEEHVSYKTSDAEESGLLGGLVSIDAPIQRSRSRTKSVTANIIPQSHIHPLLRQPSRQDGFQFSFNSERPETTHDVVEPSDVNSIIGMAVSTPPSPSIHISPDSQPTFTTVESRSLVSEKRKRPYLPPRSISIASASDSYASSSKGASLTAVNTPPSGYWEQYRATLTQQKARSNAASPIDSAPPPISKTPTTFRVPIFRSIKPGNEEDRGVKRERRLSSLWRR
ncbi:hypothetical protein BDW02DRAFT_410977 [Decorospora gaudefroyi]|uniref:DUF8004 domain-containing protein n=1 Tax=Decorospora gaudefroyi TaxID=184978 RepID=A0A6A5K4W9_9PLEO|nr:hypothetical protein BDW02DRAFT_410977 [Decorospora gaudefroyi]